MNHPDDLTSMLGSLEGTVLPPRQVLSQTGTTRSSHYAQDTSQPALTDPDALFENRAAYVAIKHEKPEHRRMLWFRLQGFNVKETALATGYTPQHVSSVCKQPWFVKAFCALSAEQGKDAVQTFLEGEVMPALQRTVELAISADSAAVRAACNRDILDRFCGKPVAKSEVKVNGQHNVTVYDAAKLQEEYRRNSEILAGRGLSAN